MSTITRNTCRHLCRAVRHKKHTAFRSVRYMLTDAYYCREVWADRLLAPTLQKVDIADYALQLQEKFDKEGLVSPIDIDIFANRFEQINKIQLDFAQTLLYRFRHTKSAVQVLDSTQHALIRALLQQEEHSRLLDILKDKIDYGIFLDEFTASFLLDHFIKIHKYQEAAEVGYDLMLQEDFSHPISRVLAWYACHLHWQQGGPVTQASVEAETVAEDGEEEEEEETLVKVNFIQNPWFDDHFDLCKDSHKLGKTLTMITRYYDNTLGRSYALIGWGMYEKFSQGLELMKTWCEMKETEVICQQALSEFGHKLDEVETKEPPQEAKDAGSVTLEDVMPYITESEKSSLQEQYKELCEKLVQSGKILETFDLEGQLVKVVNDTVSNETENDIQQQLALYKTWNEEREWLAETEKQEKKNQQRKVALMQRLESLRETEERLSYFDNKAMIDKKAVKGRKIEELEKLFESEEFQNWAPRT